jgi:hypothetical protein
LAVVGLSLPEIRDRRVPLRFRARSLAWMMWWTAVGVIAIVSNKPGGWTVPPQLILLIFLGILLALVGTLLTEVLARRRF